MMNLMMMPNVTQRRRRNEKKEKKEKEPVPPDVQAKIFCNEGASHIKAGNYHKALHAYNMVRIFFKFIFGNEWESVLFKKKF